MVRIRRFSTPFFFVLWLTLTACSDVAYSHFEEIDNNGWKGAEVVNFKPVLEDSTALYDLEIAVRHSNDYPFQNLWLYVAFRENYDIKVDTVQLILADEWGRWHGDGHGVVKTFASPYKKGYKLPEGTSFGVTIRHAMRQDPLQGITDVGLIAKKR